MPSLTVAVVGAHQWRVAPWRQTGFEVRARVIPEGSIPLPSALGTVINCQGPVTPRRVRFDAATTVSTDRL